MGRLRGAVAHDVNTTPRTVDVLLPETTTFADLLLNQRTLAGLHAAGFVRPSPIQRSAIPIGRCGTDLIIQAKSGTGKTLVFGVIALEMLDLLISQTQVLILAPTREIAVQIKEVITSIGSALPGLRVDAFIGGLSVSADVVAAKSCHVVVGTPGRIKQLVTDGSLRLRAVRLFILDEADRLVTKSFLKDVNFIFSRLPEIKQTLVVSATFPPEMEAHLSHYLVHPKRVNPSTDAILVGLRQFVATTPTHTSALVRMRHKTARLLHVLSSFAFRQCFVFCNMQSRMENICRDLASQGWPALHLAGSMKQKQRLATVAALQNQRCRVLLTTDLAARGVDAEQVDLVVNMDLPYDTETYLHRIGRAGRFGAAGVAVTIVEDSTEFTSFQNVLFKVGGPDFNVWQLPDGDIPTDVWTNQNSLKTISGIQPTNKVSEESKTSLKATSESVENVSNDVENAGKTIIRSHLIKVPKQNKLSSFEQVKEMFFSNNVISPNKSSSEESIAEELLIKAFESMNVSKEDTDVLEDLDNVESNSSFSSEDLESQNNSGYSEDWLSSEDSDDESEFWTSEEGEDFSNEESDSCSDNDEDYPIPETGCDGYASWDEWRSAMLMRRLSLQTQFYMQEMLRK